MQANDGSTITVELPFTIEFDVQRNILSSANVASIRIYNLGQRTRDQIRKDQYDYANLKQVILRAGYGDRAPVIFSGNVSQAWSVREDNTFITQIEAYDGGFMFANARMTNQYPQGTQNRDILRNIAESATQYGVQVGAIGDFPGELLRGASYDGVTVEILRQLTNGGVFIDNTKLNMLNDNEYIDEETVVINAESGLLGTPTRELATIKFDMLFEPQLNIGYRVRLDSKTAPTNFNGFYKVVSVGHKGLISESVSGNATTTVGLFYGTSELVPVPAVEN